MSTPSKQITASKKKTRPRRRRNRNRKRNNRNKNKNQTKNEKFDEQQCIGDVLDVMDDQRWYMGVIESINESNINIRITTHPLGIYGGVYVEEKMLPIDKKSKLCTNRIKPIYSETIKLNKLDNQPKVYKNIKKMVYYKVPNDYKEYIIICSRPFFKNYIYFYDIENDEYIEKYKYPSNITCNVNSDFYITINKDNNSLYIVPFDNTRYPSLNIFYVLNLSTDQWSTVSVNEGVEQNKNFDKVVIEKINAVCIVNNHLFILSNYLLFKYCLSTNKFVKRLRIDTKTNFKKIGNGSITYIENYDKLFILSTNLQWINYSDCQAYPEFFIYDLNKKVKRLNVEIILNELRWRETTTMNPKHIFYAYNHLIFIFNIYCHRFVIYDYISNRWYSKKTQIVFNGNIPRFTSSSSNECICVCSENQVHFFERNNDNHFMVWLYHFIPKKLFIIHGKYYGKLIKGFIRNKIEKKYNINITNDIQNIIIRLFPIFL